MIKPFQQRDLTGNIIRCKLHNYKMVSPNKKICFDCGFVSFVMRDNVKKKN